MEDNPLDVFPKDIKLHIFSRLPVESVLDCKLVCRAWRKDLLQFLANKTYFADLHRQYQYGHALIQQQQFQQRHHKPFEHYHHGSDPETIRMVGLQGYTPRALWYFEYYDGDVRPNYCTRKVNLELPEDVVGLVGSSNGLICLTVKTTYIGISEINRFYVPTPNEPLYVCNPVTREFVKLPRILIDEKKRTEGVHIAHGFGYHPLTNEYKVVRISYVGNPKKPSFKGRVEVYTLGSGSGWRSAGKTNYLLRDSETGGDPSGFCVNGALHWPCHDSSDIVAFDLADEEFHLLRTPYDGTFGRKLFLMRQCLCLTYWGFQLELWVLKKDKEDSSSSSYGTNEQYYKSWGWSKELAISRTVRRWSIFSLTKSGEILLTDSIQVVRCTSDQGPDSSSSTPVLELNKRFNWWNPPHINSFVSLEALGEENVKKLQKSVQPRFMNHQGVSSIIVV